jgi:hypothetical protein
MRDQHWTQLLKRIDAGKCTPFLGAGASAPNLPLAEGLAKRWAEENDYPLPDVSDLTRVSQYLAVEQDPMAPKELMASEIANAIESRGRPDFADPSEPHGLLAEFDLPVYLTTNYDDFMVSALTERGKEPVREFCLWNHYVQKKHTSVFDEAGGFEPTHRKPLVFHLHGNTEEVESMVLTEDDYLDFLVNTTRDRLIPPRVEEAMTGASLLFIGYSLADWNFRTLFRGLVGALESGLRRVSVSVQLDPDSAGNRDGEEAKRYLENYFNRLSMQVFWGSAEQFTTELRQRWTQYRDAERDH